METNSATFLDEFRRLQIRNRRAPSNKVSDKFTRPATHRKKIKDLLISTVPVEHTVNTN